VNFRWLDIEANQIFPKGAFSIFNDPNARFKNQYKI
jgi:hypothetical protein